MIQLTQDGFVCDVDGGDLRSYFETNQVLRLRGLLHSDLLLALNQRMVRGKWVEKQHGGIGREVVLNDQVALHILNFAANTPDFLSLIRSVTGCDKIARYTGRVYRMIPGTDHYDSWHDDRADERRLVGMSINLGSSPYQGGVFQLREKGSKNLVSELPNTAAGDAIIFRLSEELEHRVTPLMGTEPKTAFAGWFLSDVRPFFSCLLDHERITT